MLPLLLLSAWFFGNPRALLNESAPPSGSGGTLRPAVLPEILEAHREQVIRVLREESRKPREYLRNFDKYASLVSGQAQEDVGHFLSEPHSFQEIMVEVVHYQQLVEHVQYTPYKVELLGLFEVQSHKLIQSLTLRAQDLQNKLMERMLHDHQNINRQLCAEFETIAETALSTPSDTQELVKLKTFVQKVQSAEMPQLRQRLMDSNSQLCFLVDFVSLSPLDMRLNAETIEWLHRMPSVFRQHQQIVSEKTEHYQILLKRSCQHFVDELGFYGAQVEEFVTCGDLEKLGTYLKKAQSLQHRLEMALEKIDKFNREEEAFGWPMSQYPQRKKIQDRLAPFLRLYETASDFLKHRDEWLQGPMSEVNPEEVENYWRTLHKLEEGFGDVPRALHLASSVKAMVEEFNKCRLTGTSTLHSSPPILPAI